MTEATEAKETVKKWLAQKGSIQTRLRESDEGDREYFQRTAPDLLSLPDATIINALNGLLEDGAVVKTESVHPNDPSEYFVDWSLASEKK